MSENTSRQRPRQQRPLTIPWIAASACIGHLSLSASRVLVSLFTLAAGGNAATVGLLLALYAFVPTVSSVKVGQILDQVGTKRIMLVGLVLIAIGLCLPIMIPHRHTLWITAAMVGGGWSAYQAASQSATGRVGDPQQRTKNFSNVSLAVSISSMVGPVLAGVAVDLIGHRATFALIAVFPLTAALMMLARAGLPPAASLAVSNINTQVNSDSVWDLLRFAGVRRSLTLSAVMAMAWDAHTLLVPVYGTLQSLSPSQVGILMGAFGMATFAIRLAVHPLVSRHGPRKVITVALVIVAAAYACYPLTSLFVPLVGLSFLLGLGCGCGQPITLAQLHEGAPDHRVGEAVGLRIAVSNFVAMLLPLTLGAFATSFGMTPVFLVMTAACLTAAWSQHKSDLR